MNRDFLSIRPFEDLRRRSGMDFLLAPTAWVMLCIALLLRACFTPIARRTGL